MVSSNRKKTIDPSVICFIRPVKIMLVTAVVRSAVAVACLLACLLLVSGSRHGDPVSAEATSQHGTLRTSWVEVPPTLLPRFWVDESVVYHVPVPHLSDVADGEMKINPNEDLKVAFAFFGHLHESSWITVFDAQKKRSLRKLIVSFEADDQDVVSVEYETQYGAKIGRIDPSHPTLRGFEIEYRWSRAPGEDPAFGLQVLSGAVLIGFMAIFMVVIITAEDLSPAEDEQNARSKKAKGDKRTPNGASSSRTTAVN